MEHEDIKSIFDAGAVTARVERLEETHDGHETRIRSLEIGRATTDGKLDTIIEKLDKRDSNKLAYATTLLGGFLGLIGVIIAIFCK